MTAAARLLGRRAAVVTSLALGGALLGLGPMTWARATTWTAVSDEIAVPVPGTQAAPGVAAAGLLVLAAALVVAIGGRRAVLLAAAAIGVASGVAAASTVPFLGDPATAAENVARDVVGVGVVRGAVDVTPVPWIVVVMACAGLVLAVHLAWASARWAAPTARHERGTTAPRDDDASAWDALSRGEDPT